VRSCYAGSSTAIPVATVAGDDLPSATGGSGAEPLMPNPDDSTTAQPPCAGLMTVVASLVFVFGMLGWFCFDYSLSTGAPERGVESCAGGLNPSAWLGGQATIAVASAALAVWAVRALPRLTAILIVLGQLVAGLVLYVVAIAYYAFALRCDYL